MKKIVFKPRDEKYTELVNSFCLKKHLLSNYFGIDNNDIEYYYSESTFLIKSNYEGYSRIYLMSDNINETQELLTQLPANCVINIPSRKGVDEWNHALKGGGYQPLATYHRYVYSNYRKGSDKKLTFSTEDDIPEIIKNLNDTFSPLTGHLPDEVYLKELINNKAIVVNRNEEGVVNGALCFIIKGKRCELPFWFDKGGNGLSLLYNVFFLCHQKDIRNIFFWVNDANTDTIGIHKLLGAKEDGMVDYIFNNDKII